MHNKMEEKVNYDFLGNYINSINPGNDYRFT